MQPDKLQKLKNVLELLQRDTISPEQLKELLTGFSVAIAKIKDDTKALSEQTIKEFTEIGETLLENLTNSQKSIVEKTNDRLEQVNSGVLDIRKETKQTKDNIESVKKLLADIKKIKTTPGKDGENGLDGKDADEQKIIEEVLAKIKLPEVKEQSGEDIVSKINELNTSPDNQIDASHIKNLPKANQVHGGTKNLYQLLDVALNPNTLVTGDSLIYNATSQIWENAPAPSGITRQVILNPTNGTVLDNTAEVDYVYICAAGLVTLHMPTALGNTNRYTIKQNGSDDVIVDCVTVGETIDGGSSATLTASMQGSIDLISDGANWFII